MSPLPTGSADPKSVRYWLEPVSLGCLVLAATWAGLTNGWVQDDLPIIFMNDLVHSLGNIWAQFTSAYWPKPFPPDLYRPVALLGFSLQWAAGDGAPMIFRMVSILLYLGVVLSVWRLAGRLLPAGAAWVAAALFAVHPVHVEAVAVAVNQGELLVALILLWSTIAWIDRRRSGQSTGGWWAVGMASAYLVGILIKEHAFVLPVILVALELTVLDDRRPIRARLDQHRQLFLGLVLAVTLALAMRDFVLAGNTKGSFTAEAFVGLGVGGRLLTMLAVVPQWARLLFWPAHLQADYSLQEILPATSFGAEQWLGLSLLLLAGGVIIGLRRRLPLASFGIAWLAIALGPVHNVLVPTGIVLAERTLFLGSIGFVIAGVAVLSAGQQHVGRQWPRATRAAIVASLGGLLVMGVTRSASRQRVWHDLPTLWGQTVIDAPLSYRAHHAYGQILWTGGAKGPAEYHLRRAIDLNPDAWHIYVDLANRYRIADLCYPAMELYRTALIIFPANHLARTSFIACQLHEGRYADAATTARAGVEIGVESERFERYATIADSALQVGAAVGSVVLPDPVSDEAPSP
jgi:hypothetical protein